ncbi:MAG: VPLPA-CTERM sorting domain-containing protein [Pseudomonadota bacterium]
MAFTDGQLPLAGGLTAFAACGAVGAGGSCTVNADFSSSLRLLAGTVRDAAGLIVSNAVVTSDSGFDYLVSMPPHDRPQVVPLPAAGYLMLAGLGAIAVMAKRRRRAPQDVL